MQRAWLLLLGILSAGAAPTPTANEPPAFEQPVRVELVNGAGAPEIPLVLVAASTDRSPAVEVRREMRLPSHATTRLALAAGVWLLRVEGQGVWAPPRTIDVAEPSPGSPPPDAVVAEVWRTGHLTLTLAPGQAPSGLSVTFEGSPSAPAPRVPHDSSACAPASSSAWTCEVPAATLDLRLGTRGLVPRYFWDTAVPPGRALPLGFVLSEHGASVSGFVFDSIHGAQSRSVGSRGSGGGSPPLNSGARIHFGRRVYDDQRDRPAAECDVTLRTLDAQPIVPDGRRGRPLQTRTNARGFFQLTGTPAGQYLLEARHAARGRATTTVEIREQHETRLPESLVLSAPASVELVVNPALDPDGRPWSMRWLNLSVTPVEEAARRSLPPSGRLRFETAAGRFLLVLARHDGTRWAERLVEVGAPVEYVELDAAAVHVHGTVTLGRRPLPARVIFGGARGVVSVALQAGADGEYAGSLPRRERWTVEVQSTEPRLQRLLADVQPEVETATGEWRFDVRLPETRLSGRVTDEGGRPLPRAIVTVQPAAGASAEPRLQSFSGDDDGAFEFAGLPPGETVVSAEVSEELVVEPVTVSVREDGPTEVQIVARRGLRLRGRVVAESGEPLVGAFVKVVAAGAGPFVRAGSLARTDAGGMFTVTLPAGTTQALVTVGGPGHALRLARLPVAPRQMLDLPLRRAGGALVLEPPEGWRPDGREGQVLAVYANGGREDLTILLANWAIPLSGFGPPSLERLVIPQLAPGDYTACLEQPYAPGPAPRCASGTLNADTELLLRLR